MTRNISFHVFCARITNLELFYGSWLLFKINFAADAIARERKKKRKKKKEFRDEFESG